MNLTGHLYAYYLFECVLLYVLVSHLQFEKCTKNWPSDHAPVILYSVCAYVRMYVHMYVCGIYRQGYTVP